MGRWLASDHAHPEHRLVSDIDVVFADEVEPAAVVDIMERMLSRFAFSLIASMVDADGSVAVVALKRALLGK